MLTFGYSDFRQLLRIEDPQNFAPGVELRENGVYVRTLSELEERVIPGDSPEMFERLKHPTGNLSEPVLSFPCNLGELEEFVNVYAPDSIYPFDLVKVLKRRAFEQARIEAKEQDEYYWPIFASIHGLRNRLERWLGREEIDSKKVVLREILDDLEEILAGSKEARQPESNDANSTDPRRRTTLLRIIRALATSANLPERAAAPSVEKRLQELGFDSPKDATIRSALNEARALEPDRKPQ